MYELFNQLSEFSSRLFQSLDISWQSFTDGLKRFSDRPNGAIVHYTGGSDAIKTVKWFMEPRWRSGVSAHFVIAQGWSDSYKHLAYDLPLVSALPTMVVQCVPLDCIAIHAKRVNSMFYGIELANPGQVIRRNRQWVSKATKQPLSIDEGVYLAHDNYWTEYPVNQLRALVVMLRALRQTHGVEPSRILGHEHVQRNKRDPGPLMPLSLIRSDVARDASSGILAYVSPRYAVTRRGYVWRDWSDIWGSDMTSIMEEAREALQASDVDAAVVGLDALGYHVDSDLDFSVRMFQLMAGLDQDGIVGPKTVKAVYKRLKQLNFLNAPEY